jgi:cysteinyl-tRNA synthetase
VLNIVRAREYPKATEHIGEIQAMIARLIGSGHAYVENGSVYFRVSAFADYGRLANLKIASGRRCAPPPLLFFFLLQY